MIDAAGAAPIIVTAMLGEADFAWLDALRRQHFPLDRNHIAAHLTMFHHLAPSLGPEIKQRLLAETRGVRPPPARIAGLINLGRGVAFAINAPELEAIRDRLADAFAPMLTPQDRAGWRPHITVQNKVPPAEARALHAALEAALVRRPIAITGLASWWYRGGPWALLSRHRFGA